MSLDKPKNLLTDAERLQVAQHLEQSVHYGAPVGFGSRRVTGSPPPFAWHSIKRSIFCSSTASEIFGLVPVASV